MKKYYIYHIKGVKIGVSVEPERRVVNQGFTEYEILETHNCKYLVSYRELALQKEYGYPVDTTMYYQSKAWRQKGCVKGGSIGGKISGPIVGKIAVESGHLEKARKIAIQKTSKPVLVYKKDGTFVGEFSSQQECARQLNLYNHITSVCNGKRKSVGGYVIKFKPTEDET